MKKEDIKCCMCGENSWKNLDYLRPKKMDFVICEKCGFVTYLIPNNDYLVDMYKNHKHNKKRSYSGSNDDKTKANKLSYHRKFLGDTLKKKKNMSILDFGCSTGYVLKMCRDEYGHKDVMGIELNAAHAAYGRGELGLDIQETETVYDLQEDKKYDLIILFAVLEHLLNPVDCMREFKKRLKPDGQMYVMVPLWFGSLLDSEKRVGPFEHLFVPHHINCFSRNHINNVFKLVGFKPVQYCNTMYGHMFLLDQCETSNDIELDDAKKINDIELDDAKKIVEEISRIKKAIELHYSQKFDESLEAYPHNPEAWIAKAIVQFKDNFNEQLKCLDMALQVDKSHTPAMAHIGNLYMQANDYENALKFLEAAINMSPNAFQSYQTIAEIYHIKGEYDKSIYWCRKLISVNPRIADHAFSEGGLTVRDMIGVNYAHMARDYG